jgi:hypothetical protein
MGGVESRRREVSQTFHSGRPQLPEIIQQRPLRQGAEFHELAVCTITKEKRKLSGLVHKFVKGLLW